MAASLCVKILGEGGCRDREKDKGRGKQRIGADEHVHRETRREKQKQIKKFY